jgi:hypothetical protein
MLRHCLLVGILLLSGCENIIGPFQPRGPGRVDDPLLTINEQQKLGRERLALPDDSPSVGPNVGLEVPSSRGR